LYGAASLRRHCTLALHDALPISTSGLPGNAFATIGTGSTIYAGELLAGGDLTINQEFIVNGTVESGIYSIPITVRYTTEGGETRSDEHTSELQSRGNLACRLLLE